MKKILLLSLILRSFSIQAQQPYKIIKNYPNISKPFRISLVPAKLELASDYAVLWGVFKLDLDLKNSFRLSTEIGKAWSYFEPDPVSTKIKPVESHKSFGLRGISMAYYFFRKQKDITDDVTLDSHRYHAGPGMDRTNFTTTEVPLKLEHNLGLNAGFHQDEFFYVFDLFQIPTIGINANAPHDTLILANEDQGTYEQQAVLNIGISYRRIKNSSYEINYESKTKKYKLEKVRELYLDIIYDISHQFTPVTTIADAQTRNVVVPAPFHKFGWKLGMDLQTPDGGLTWGIECGVKPQYTNSFGGFICLKIGYQLGIKIPALTLHAPEQK